MRDVKGIIHVHSNFSYDGEHSLDEIAQYARQRGYSFVGMSEHSNGFNVDKMSEYVEECYRASSPECFIIPGIEFACKNNLHLLGLGIHHYTNSKDPLEVCEFIKQNGAVAIVAHPKRYDYKVPTQLAPSLDGIEVWNAAYDGRFVPNDRSLNLLIDLRNRNGSMVAFSGQDLHQLTHHPDVHIVVSSTDLCPRTILKALKEGQFRMVSPYFQLDARCTPGRLRLGQIIAVRWMYNLARWMRDVRVATVTN